MKSTSSNRSPESIDQNWSTRRRYSMNKNIVHFVVHTYKLITFIGSFAAYFLLFLWFELLTPNTIQTMFYEYLNCRNVNDYRIEIDIELVLFSSLLYHTLSSRIHRIDVTQIIHFSSSMVKHLSIISFPIQFCL